MDICSKHGSEIAHEKGYCPACDEINHLKLQITDLKDRISELEEKE